MTILTVILSNGTTTDGATASTLLSHHTVKHLSGIAISGKVELLNYTVIHLNPANQRSLLEIRLPWLQTGHVIGGSSNPSVNSPNAAVQAHDLVRGGDVPGIILAATQTMTSVECNNRMYSGPPRMIPNTYNVSVIDASTGLGYANFATIVLSFKMHSSGLLR